MAKGKGRSKKKKKSVGEMSPTEFKKQMKRARSGRKGPSGAAKKAYYANIRKSWRGLKKVADAQGWS